MAARRPPTSLAKPLELLGLRSVVFLATLRAASHQTVRFGLRLRIGPLFVKAALVLHSHNATRVCEVGISHLKEALRFWRVRPPAQNWLDFNINTKERVDSRTDVPPAQNPFVLLLKHLTKKTRDWNVYRACSLMFALCVPQRKGVHHIDF